MPDDDVQAKREEVDALRDELREAVAEQREEARSGSTDVQAERLDAEADRLRAQIEAVRSGRGVTPAGSEARTEDETAVVLPPDATKDEAMEAARKLEVEGRSSMSKDELVEAVEEAQEEDK